MNRKLIIVLLSVLVAGGLPARAGDWSLARKIERQITEPVFRDADYPVTSYGAVADGRTDAVRAINEAIRKCSSDGGGRVILPAGEYFCKGPVRLCSNVNLHFEDGASLVFSTDEDDYLPCVLTRWEGTELFNYSPLVYAYNVMNIAITGKGVINGQGKANFEGWKAGQKPDQAEIRRMGTSQVPVYERVFGKGHLLRPAMVELFACNTVLIEDVKLVDGTFWSFHLIGCSNAMVRGVSVDCENLNSDGVDPESCRNMIIENCHFHTGDDGIAVKSGRDQDGWRLAQPTENLIIRNCTFDTFANGLCIGSEISGGVRNIFVEKCHIVNAKQGIYFKSNLDRGGYIENVYVRDITVENVDAALVKFEPDYKSESRQHHPTLIRNFKISGVRAATAGQYGIYAVGFDDLPIENVEIRDLVLGNTPEPYLIRNVRGLTLKNVSINGERISGIIDSGRLPVLPYPDNVEFLPSVHPSAWRGFVLDSAYPEDETAAVWDEICVLAVRGAGHPALRVRIVNDAGEEGYSLEWKSDRVEIVSHDSDNAFWALQTLKQLLRAGYVQDIAVRDSPDMQRRVFMDDVSRGAVPTLGQMKRQIRLLSELKYNGYMLYNENVIRTSSHPDIAPPEAAISLAEMDEIVAYAKDYHIEVIGAFQSFGHLEKTLTLPQYRDMGLTSSMIDPYSQKARRFLEDVIPELALHSSSDFFCVFCDETFDIDNLPDRETIYADHLNFLHGLLSSLGKRMIVCGDMMMKYPGILEKIPQDIVIFSWNYDAPESFAPWLDAYGGREVWIAPGVHSSLRMLPDMRIAEGNRRFVREGYGYGSRGCIVCTWDESTYHSVENLTYGIAQFAESMWNHSLVLADDDFRTRYELVRFGNVNGATDAYRELMRLGDIPMFSGMNDRVFHSSFIPREGEPLCMDFSQLHLADSLLSGIESRMCSAISGARSNVEELQAWDYVIRCYRFMTDARLSMTSLSPESVASTCASLVERLDSLETMFLSWWDRENRPYSRQAALDEYAGWRQEVSGLLRSDLSSLQVIDRENPYMGFFLTAVIGPGDRAALQPLWPTPGASFTTDGGSVARWTKTETLDGPVIDLNRFYPGTAPGTELRCYAVINAPCDMDAALLLGYVGDMDLYVGEEKVWSGGIRNAHVVDDARVDIHLVEGRNHIVLILRKLFPEFSLSSYLEGAKYKSSKYRYTLL